MTKHTCKNSILHARKPLSVENALLVEAILGIEAKALVLMQADYDMIMAKRNKAVSNHISKINKANATTGRNIPVPSAI